MAKDDEISFDFNLTPERKKQLFIVLLVLIPLFLAVFFRAFPATLPATDNWAESSVNSFYQQQISAQVKADFPNLPDAQLQERVNQQYAALREQNGAAIEQQIAGTSESFKQQLKNDKGETYLLAIDPWYYLQEAENQINNGHAGTSLKDGRPWNDKLLAPLGGAAQQNWHSKMIVIIWTILGVFIPGISLMGASFWVPLIVASASVIPAFFLARRRAGNLGGFIAASVVAVHSAFLGRTPAGFSDTDAYNVFFPLLVAWLFLEAFEAKELWKKLTLAGGAGLSLGIYSQFWAGYWYILDIIIAVVIGYMGFVTVKHFYQNYLATQHNKKTTSWTESRAWHSIKDTAMVFGVFFLTTGIIVSLAFSVDAFFKQITGFLSFSQLKNAVTPALWPNVLTTVAELNEVNFAGVVGSMGGKFLYWLALMGVAVSVIPQKMKGRHLAYLGSAILITVFLISGTVLNYAPLTYLIILGIPLAIGLLVSLNDKDGADIKFAMLLLVWFIAAMYTTTKGVRFTLVLVPALAVAVGTFAGIAHRQFTQILSQSLDISKKIVVPVLAILFCLIILLTPIKTANAVALNEIPSMNDGWYNTLTGIRDASEPDAIITSWWDFGHWFKTIAERRVTFDGGSQATPMAHWVGKLLLTTDEDESRDILRMLDCGSYTAYDEINDQFQDAVRSKVLLNELIVADKETARTLLSEAGFSAEQQEIVLEKTHCQPPEGFLITSQDMVGKAGVWGHFGSWDFERAYIYNDLRKKTQDEAVQEMVNRFGYEETKARQLYSEVRAITSEPAANAWVSPWPSYSGSWIGCKEQVAAVNTSALGLNNKEELENRTVAVCTANLRISTSAQGDVVIENILIDIENPEVSRFRYGIYSGGVRYQASDEGKPQVMYFAHNDSGEGIERFDFGAETSGLGLLYDEERQRALLTDPLHAGSVFTQLFFLDGKYNENYELFSDVTTFNGQRITVWKVVWE